MVQYRWKKSLLNSQVTVLVKPVVSIEEDNDALHTGTHTLSLCIYS